MFSFNHLKKNLKLEVKQGKPIKFAILADSASQLLNQAIKGYGIEMGIQFDIYEADYDQISIQIFDYKSELYAFDPEYIFINCSSEYFLKEFYSKSGIEKLNYAAEKIKALQNACETLSAKLNTKIIINTYGEINDAVFGHYATRVEGSFIYQLRKTNYLLMDLVRKHNNLFICDLAALQAQLGYTFTFDPKMYVNASMVYSLDFLPYIAKAITDIVAAVSGSFKKCIILDLDNTIWGGVIGDDGVEGIQIGDLGNGKAYTDLQLWIRQLKQRGIILAVCSKNSEDIAKEPFEKHPEMVLRLDDIAVFVANWENKVDNIRYIQSVLNISYDAMVFLDDSPFEREIVKMGIPTLTIPELPEDPADYLPFLRTLNLFETASYTEEDEQRTKQYRAESIRTIIKTKFENEEAFLQNLGMKSITGTFNSFTLPRIAQLTQRSNQFNLRTTRYTEGDLALITESPDYFTISFTLEDNYGDMGLIGAVILKKEKYGALFIDTWIMSCRVLKRGIENFTLNTIIDIAKNKNCKTLIGEYLPTKKNGIVKDHYSQLGFRQEGEKWVLEIEGYIPRQTYIKKKS